MSQLGVLLANPRIRRPASWRTVRYGVDANNGGKRPEETKPLGSINAVRRGCGNPPSRDRSEERCECLKVPGQVRTLQSPILRCDAHGLVAIPGLRRGYRGRERRRPEEEVSRSRCNQLGHEGRRTQSLVCLSARSTIASPLRELRASPQPVLPRLANTCDTVPSR